jgi:hypothetical protein
MNKLGEMIGQVVDNFSITNARGETTSMRITWDFSTASDNDIRSWLAGNRRIAFQRPSRALSIAELNELDGSTILATSAGKKVKSRDERIAELMASGLPEKLAIFAVDNPSQFASIVENIDTNETSE